MDSSVTAKLASSQRIHDGHFGPFVLIEVGLINLLLSSDVGLEISWDEVPIVVVGDCTNQAHEQLFFSKGSRSDCLDGFFKLWRNVIFRAHRRHFLLEIFNRVYSCSEDEDVVISYLLMDLDVSSVHRSEDQPTVHYELHVAGAWGFSARSWDVLAEFWGGDDELGIRDVIVGQEYYFE